MKVLAFASYPVEAAATRYRLHQFVEPLSRARNRNDLASLPRLESICIALSVERRRRELA